MGFPGTSAEAGHFGGPGSCKELPLNQVNWPEQGIDSWKLAKEMAVADSFPTVPRDERGGKQRWSHLAPDPGQGQRYDLMAS